VSDNASLMRLVDKMPAFPVSVQRVIELTSDMHCDPRELVHTLDHDPVLTVKILKVANSAYFGVATKIASIKHAVVYLGLNTVKHIAVTVASIGVMPRTNVAGLDMDGFLAHSLTTAVLARRLAQQSNVSAIKVQEHFVAGLLHDIGQAVWAHFRAETYQQVLELAGTTTFSRLEAERQILGTTHGELGGLLAEKWQFSPPLVAAIRHHHLPAEESAGNIMRDTVLVASQLAHLLRSEPHEPLTERLEDCFSGPAESLLHRRDGLEDELERAWSYMQL
jgi:putative nucleotidyltransferase with HDIG domain